MPGTKTTTEADAALLVKKRLWYSIPIDLGSGRTDFVQIRGDALDYFSIAIPTAATGGLKEVIRKTTGTVSRYGAGLADTTPTEVAVELTQRFTRPPRLSAGGGGRRIIVPTELITPKKNIRVHTIRFPSKAINAAISVFIFTQFKTKVPSWFKTEFGTRYAVVGKGSVTDINSGNQATDQTTPT